MSHRYHRRSHRPRATLAPPAAGPASPGLTRTAPGVYAGADGTVHFDIPELLAAHGYAYTPENLEVMAGAIRTWSAEHGIPFAETEAAL